MNIESYRKRFVRANKQAYNTFGWAMLIDDLKAEAQYGGPWNRLDSILSNLRGKIQWSEPENVLEEFLDEEWDNLEERRKKIKTLVKKCELFSVSDVNENSLTMSERVKIGLFTEVFGLTDIHQEDGNMCPAYELDDYTFTVWVDHTIGLVEEHYVEPEKIQTHIDLMAHILESGGIDMTPGLSYPCSRVTFVTACNPKTVVLSGSVIELEGEELRIRETVEMKEGETVQLPKKTAEKLVEQKAAAKFVYRCESCGNSMPRNKPNEEPSKCPECGSSNINSIHPETPKEIADVLEKYYRQDISAELPLEDLTAAFATGLTAESYPEIGAEQAWELGSKVVPGKETSFLDKVVDQFLWTVNRGNSNKGTSEEKSLRHEGNPPIERIARGGGIA